MASLAGRPSKPSYQKELEGTARPDRTNKYEPKLPAHLPDRPPWVDDDKQSADLFDQITEYVTMMSIHTQVDGVALSLLADQMATYLRLRQVVLEEGEVIEQMSGAGNPIKKVHPALPQMQSCFAAILRMLREYGLTASSRANVSANLETEINTFEDFING